MLFCIASLPVADLRNAARLLILEPKDFSPADLLSLTNRQYYQTVEQVVANVAPAVRAQSSGPVRILPRIKPGRAVIHLVNCNYDASEDRVKPISTAQLKIDLQSLGLAGTTKAKLFAPDHSPIALPLQGATLTLPELGLWAIVELRRS